MNPTNSLIIEGNLVRDPVLSETPKGTKVCNFTVASNHYFKKGDEYKKDVTFLDVEAWTSLATEISSEFKKGKGIRVVGRLKQDRWEDPEGKTHSRMKVVADCFEKRPTFFKNDNSSDSSNAETAAESSVI